MSDLARSEEQGNRGALDGVRVLDLTPPGGDPSATLMLAFLGAVPERGQLGRVG